MTENSTSTTNSRLAFDSATLVRAAQDAVYIGVGFGVLAIQKLQVRRVELTKAFEARIGSGSSQATETLKSIERQLSDLVPSDIGERVERLETKIDALVDSVQERLPAPAAQALGHVHTIARQARQQVVSRVA